jgi:hypothetical protein
VLGKHTYRAAGFLLALGGLLGCGASSGGGSVRAETVGHTEPASDTLTVGYVAAVNARCVELDRRKTATYRDALADSALTIPEYLLAQQAYLPEAHQFDTDVAKLVPATAADKSAQTTLSAYATWVESRRQALDAVAAKGDEAAFGAALEHSNEGFFESEPVQAMTAAGFVRACLSR